MSPRYLAYCRSKGMSPEDTLAADTIRYPDARMAGFTIWVYEKWREFTAVHPYILGHVTEADHAAFDAWLEGAR